MFHSLSHVIDVSFTVSCYICSIHSVMLYMCHSLCHVIDVPFTQSCYRCLIHRVMLHMCQLLSCYIIDVSFNVSCYARAIHSVVMYDAYHVLCLVVLYNLVFSMSFYITCVLVSSTLRCRLLIHCFASESDKTC